MAGPVLLDSTYRAQIHTDINATWTGADAPDEIRDGRVRLSKKAANYPYALVILSNFAQQQAGLKRVTQTYTYEITYVGLLTQVTGVLATKAIALASALESRLMTNVLYAGEQCVRIVSNISFDSGQVDGENLPTFEFTLIFDITSDARY
jgi:hypothetical protein